MREDFSEISFGNIINSERRDKTHTPTSSFSNRSKRILTASLLLVSLATSSFANSNNTTDFEFSEPSAFSGYTQSSKTTNISSNINSNINLDKVLLSKAKKDFSNLMNIGVFTLGELENGEDINNKITELIGKMEELKSKINKDFPESKNNEKVNSLLSFMDGEIDTLREEIKNQNKILETGFQITPKSTVYGFAFRNFNKLSNDSKDKIGSIGNFSTYIIKTNNLNENTIAQNTEIRVNIPKIIKLISSEKKETQLMTSNTNKIFELSKNIKAGEDVIDEAINLITEIKTYKKNNPNSGNIATMERQINALSLEIKTPTSNIITTENTVYKVASRVFHKLSDSEKEKIGSIGELSINIIKLNKLNPKKIPNNTKVDLDINKIIALISSDINDTTVDNSLTSFGISVLVSTNEMKEALNKDNYTQVNKKKSFVVVDTKSMDTEILKEYMITDLVETYHINEVDSAEIVSNLSEAIYCFYGNESFNERMYTFYSQILMESSGNTEAELKNNREHSFGLSQFQLPPLKDTFNKLKRMKMEKSTTLVEMEKIYNKFKNDDVALGKLLKDPKFNIFSMVAMNKINITRINRNTRYNKENNHQIIKDIFIDLDYANSIKGFDLDIMVSGLMHNGGIPSTNSSHYLEKLIKTTLSHKTNCEANNIQLASNDKKQTKTKTKTKKA